uniref:Reverse transcriptase domain-containing protein n=1 Tax=Tanacetum cinerariifolium TaxID=118510 RepID=A0A6L2LH41_TANCI|nr:reverse transcriptase domain-containing protein [Tanacetum cinerariifolium]
MSSASSAVTYTSVNTVSEPGRVFWGADKELSDGGSLRVIVYGYDGLPMLPVAPPSPDYIPGLKSHRHHQHHSTRTSMSLRSYRHMILISCQSQYTLRYVAESDPEEDPKEYEEDETEDGPVDYPMDRGYDGDDDDGDSSGYDADDEDEDEEDEEEEEEHLAPADSIVVIPIDELVSPPEGIEPIIPPSSTDTTTTGARITIRPQTFISLPPEAEVERILAMPNPSPSPLTSLSPPSAGERLARCMAPAALPSPLLPPSSYPSPPVDCRDGIPESEQPPRKRLCLSTLSSRYEVGESSTRGRGVDYGFADTVEAEIVTELVELHEHDTRDLYALLEDAQDGRTRISQRVAMDSQRVDLLMGDRMTLQEIVWIMEEEAYAAREAWAHSVRQIMAPVTRQGQNPPPPNTNTLPHHMTPKSVQAMIDQALLRNSTNGDGSQSSHKDNPRHVKTTRPCFYADFMKCYPLNFKGNEGITLGPEAYAMTWEVLKKKLKDKYCPQGELKKLDIELCNLKVKGNNVSTYTNRFQKMTLMDQKLRTYAERADNKRKTDDTSRNNHGHQQQPLKKQNFARVYNIGTGERKPYEGSLPKCTKCQHHHNGPYTQKCHKCNKVGHFARDCRSSSNANVANAQRDGKETPKGNGCFECGASGHFKRDCPKLKNKNGGSRNAQGWVYAVGNAEKNENAPMNPVSNVVTELGSFDVIIGMDWLRRCHAVIVCDEKLVQIPYGNETLTFCGKESNNKRESRLAVISCSKAQEYMAKGCQIFMAQISAKKEEDKSKGKQIKDVRIVRDFPKVFPKDLPGLPPARRVEFQIDLIPGAAPVARAPYRLAPSEMQELSEQLQELSDKGFIRPSSSP